MMKLVKAYLASDKKLMAKILFLGVAAVVCAVGLMFVAGYLISASSDGIYSILVLNIPLAFVQIFGLGKPIARYFERLKSHEWVLKLTSHLRLQLFNKVQMHALENTTWRTGDVLGSLASDIENVQNLYLRTVFPVLIAWIVGLLLVVIAGLASLLLLVFAFGMLILLCILFPLLSILLQRNTIARASETRAELYGSVTDMVMGAQDVAISGRGEEVVSVFSRTFANLRKLENRLSMGNRIRLVLLQFLLLLALLVVVGWGVAHFGGVHGGSANWIAAVALGFFPLIDIFAPISKQFEDGIAHKESLERLSKRGFFEDAPDKSHREFKPDPAMGIELDHLAYWYGGGEIVLDNINLFVPYGQKLAILGKSGSGKTTLAHLIHGDLDPSEGTVRIGGVDTRLLRDHIWEYVGLISQNSYIFAMSVIDNLRIGKIEVTEEEAWHALDAVGMKEHVENLPEGLETMADEAGLNFSGGQRQRLVLARVLLQNPPIVLLDEPTVGLDPITEHLVLSTVQQAFAGKTVVAITHHLQGVDLFDRVLFVEDGFVVMDGKPKTLSETNERYRRLLAFDRGTF